MVDGASSDPDRPADGSLKRARTVAENVAGRNEMNAKVAAGTTLDTDVEMQVEYTESELEIRRLNAVKLEQAKAMRIDAETGAADSQLLQATMLLRTVNRDIASLNAAGAYDQKTYDEIFLTGDPFARFRLT
jgi:hypothetical protein